MKPKSRMSIVLVTKWASNYLKLCLDSLEKNSVYDNELIIVCDDPSWQTVKLLQDRDLPYWTTMFGNLWLNSNFGAKKATREYIGFLNDDVYMGPRWDEAMEEIIAPNVLGSLANLNLNNSPHHFGFKTVEGMYDVSKFDPAAFDDFCVKNATPVRQSFFWMPHVVTKDVFYRYGGFTYYSSQGCGHEIEFENRAKSDGLVVVTSYKSYMYHFGNAGNRDGVRTQNRAIWRSHGFFGCSSCGNVTPNETGADSGLPEIEFIKKSGYWLCEKCRKVINDSDYNTKLKLRWAHAWREWHDKSAGNGGIQIIPQLF